MEQDHATLPEHLAHACETHSGVLARRQASLLIPSPFEHPRAIIKDGRIDLRCNGLLVYNTSFASHSENEEHLACEVEALPVSRALPVHMLMHDPECLRHAGSISCFQPMTDPNVHATQLEV